MSDWVVTTDASVDGVAMCFRNSPSDILHCTGRHFDVLSSVMTFPHDLSDAGGDKEQVYREGWASCLR